MSADPEISGSLSSEPPERYDTRVEVALPLRVTFWDCENKPLLDMACTYDISSRGARISGLRVAAVEAGDIVAIERGKNKTFCRVVWVGGSTSKQRGQVGIQTVEADRLMWDTELREMSTVFDPFPVDKKASENNSARFREENRRKHSRFKVEGIAEVNAPASRTPLNRAALKNLSELGCLISIQNAPPLGSDLTLILKIENYEFNLTGQVRHVDTGDGTGIRFHKIRKGDRQMLQHLLRKLAEQHLEQSFEIVLQR